MTVETYPLKNPYEKVSSTLVRLSHRGFTIGPKALYIFLKSSMVVKGRAEVCRRCLRLSEGTLATQAA